MAIRYRKKYQVKDIYSDNLQLVKKFPFIYYQTPRIYDKTVFPNKLLVTDIGLISDKKDIISDYALNVSNIESILYLQKLGVKKITLSVEVTLDELKFFPDLSNYPVEVLIYGKVVVMVLKKHSILNKDGYTLENDNEFYDVKIGDNKEVMIFSSKPIDNIKEILEYQKHGIKNFRIDFFRESKEEIQKILSIVSKKMST